MIKRFTTIIVLIMLSLIIGWFAAEWYNFLNTPLVKRDQPTYIMFKKGKSTSDFAHQLYKLGLIRHPIFFDIMVRVERDGKILRAGEYKISPGMKPQQLINMMVKGKVILHRLTIIEGWTFKRMLRAVEKNEFLKHTLKGLSRNEVMTKLGYPNEHPEGRFFPDTYMFSRGTSDRYVLRKAYQLMKKRLHKVWQKRAKNLPFKTAYQALIVASMIEKETGVPKERAMVAGVIVRRLEKNMYLQIDPTLLYGIYYDYNGNTLTRSELRLNTPYNTYLNKGLPPTPIALPGLASLKAAVNPAAGNYLYFVAIGKGDGSHVFSATLKQHNANVKKYILNAKMIKKNEKILEHEREEIDEEHRIEYIKEHKFHRHNKDGSEINIKKQTHDTKK